MIVLEQQLIKSTNSSRYLQKLVQTPEKARLRLRRPVARSQILVPPPFLKYSDFSVLTIYLHNKLKICNKQVVMSLYQQSKIIDQKISVSTEADSLIELQKAQPLSCLASKITEKALEHHKIAANVTTSIFTSDKILKLTSSVLKVVKSYKLSENLKGCEKLGGQIGQVRRLLRVDRVLMLIKELVNFFRKKQTSFSDKAMMLFKIMILMEDLTDLRSFLIQLKLLKGQHLLGDLRKRVAVLYFMQCMGWFLYHSKEYYASKTEEDKDKNKMAMLKYLLDGCLAHNEMPHKLFALEPTTSSFLALLSGGLNIYLVWK